MNIAIGQVDPDESIPDIEDAVLGDTDYMFIFHEIILPLAREFNPELVLVPAGTKFHPQKSICKLLVVILHRIKHRI